MIIETMETQLLKEEHIYPGNDILKKALGNSFNVYEELHTAVTSPGLDLVPEWRYYKDGGAWLCKVCHRKNTVFWLSVWDGFFRVAFYFTEKHRPAIEKLEISRNIKSDFAMSRAVGRLLPLVLMITSEEQLPDLLKIIEFKRSQK